MPLKTVKVDNVAQIVVEILAEYKDACAEDVEEAAKAAADEAVRELRTTSPRAKKHRNRTVYAEGWKAKRTENKRGIVKYVVYNATDARRTMLLENGHAVVDRNRKKHGNTAERKHIQPAEENAVRTFERLIKEKIQKE